MQPLYAVLRGGDARTVSGFPPCQGDEAYPGGEKVKTLAGYRVRRKLHSPYPPGNDGAGTPETVKGAPSSRRTRWPTAPLDAGPVFR